MLALARRAVGLSLSACRIYGCGRGMRDGFCCCYACLCTACRTFRSVRRAIPERVQFSTCTYNNILYNSPFNHIWHGKWHAGTCRRCIQKPIHRGCHVRSVHAGICLGGTIVLFGSVCVCRRLRGWYIFIM